jgi:multidrug efflux pump subunit AcrA (membrane-fusion protein)
MKRKVAATLVVIVAMIGWTAVRADEDASKSAAGASSAQSETHTVTKGRFQVAVALDAMFWPGRMSEITVRPESWKELIVVEAVPHGSTVKKGDTLVKLDHRALDDEIRDEEAARKQADLAIQQLQAEIRVHEPSLPVDLAVAERAKKNADSDLENFLQVDRDATKRRMEMQVKQMQVMVDYQKDELEQLEKMYKADDLTEETEELILKRQRNWLEMAQAYLEIVKLERDRALQVELPRKEADLRENVGRQTVALERSRTTLPLALSKLKVDLEKQKHDSAKAGDKLKKLKRDALLLTVVAPADGTVYYGSFIHGQWSGASSATDKLKRGGTLSPHEVFMTVVEPDSLSVHASAAEKDVAGLTSAMACQITPQSDSAARLRGTIAELAPVPDTSGKFDVLVKLSEDNPQPTLKPVAGMKCTVKTIVYDTPSALSVPTAALVKDEFDDGKYYVNLVDQDGKHARRDVTVGHRNDTSVEITSGLAEGDKILATKPHEDKKS